ncbi:pupal cuticle protein 36-like [Eriocheir sinensis]|uniref:pupal cuticle protein 36-like n=1 Tax=Eriocheir sinensis TaxID=95602 RepID=UPI0021C88ED8|nr:pupal cuticle protein 36-like [Eriocheir sinensis]
MILRHFLTFHTTSTILAIIAYPLLPGLPSRPKPKRLVWVLGVVVGGVVGVAGVAAGMWWMRGRGNSHTLRNREDCLTKLHKPDLTGNGRDTEDSLGVNGVVQHTIYDSMGRYRGFAHLHQNDMYQNSMLTPSAAATTTVTAAPSPPPAEVTTSTLTSKLSLIKRGKPSATPAPPLDPKFGGEAINGKGGSGGGALGGIGIGSIGGLVGGLGGGVGSGLVKDTRGGIAEIGGTALGITGGCGGDGKEVVGSGGSSGGVGSVISGAGTGYCSRGGGSDGVTTGSGATTGAEKDISEAPWQKMINQLTSSTSDSKFFDVWRIPGVKNVRQHPPNESVL